MNTSYFWFNIFIPSIGCFLASFLGWASVPNMLKDRKNNNLTKDPLPYPIAFLTVFSFIIYGILVNDYWTTFGNILPTIGNFINLIISLRLCKNVNTIFKLEIINIFGIILIIFELLVSFSSFIITNNLLKIYIITYFTIILCSLMFIIPTIETFNSIKNKNSNNISLPLSLAGISCSSFWTIYGYTMKLTGLWIPNAIGILFTGFTLFIKLLFIKN